MIKAVEATMRHFPELHGLIALCTAGWRFFSALGSDGMPGDLYGFREWPGEWLDTIRIHSSTNVMGLRSDGGDPPGLVWELTGSLVDVVDGLLALPSPDGRPAPRLVLGTAPTLWTPLGRR